MVWSGWGRTGVLQTDATTHGEIQTFVGGKTWQVSQHLVTTAKLKMVIPIFQMMVCEIEKAKVKRG